MLDICLLGTGGMMPLPNRWLSSALFRHNGKMILIDCGEGTQIPMKIVGWGFKNIDAICFTHFHADHIAGLPGLLLSIGNSGRTGPLTLTGPEGLKEIVGGLMVISPELPFELKLVELPLNQLSEIKINDYLIRSLPVDHARPCLSYSIEIKRQGKFNINLAKELEVPQKYWKQLQRGEIIELDGRLIKPEMILEKERKGIKVSFCTDTRPTDDIPEFIFNSDLFICEGMYGEDEKLQNAVERKHMLFSEASRLALAGMVKEMWLTHYSPAIVEPENYLSNATEIFNNSFLGRDLMIKQLHFT